MNLFGLAIFLCVVLMRFNPLARIIVETSADENGETINATLHFSCVQVTDVTNYTCFAVVPSEGEAPVSSKTVVLEVGGKCQFIYLFLSL